MLSSSDSEPQRHRFSIDSEASAILSYALGKERPDDNASQTSDDDDDENDIEVLTTPLSGVDDEEAFLKENDPLTLDFEPRPFKRVSLTNPLLCVLFLFGGGKLTLRRNHESFDVVYGECCVFFW